jgi:ElaB/YqjD/DUF883 family membrane-anchored ribosome-binding protein
MVQEGRVGEFTSPDIRADLESIRSDLAALRAEVSNLVHDVVFVGKDRAGDARQSFMDAARSRLDQVGSAWEQASGQGKEIVENLSARIEERPLTSIGIAFGTGVVVGVLLRR